MFSVAVTYLIQPGAEERAVELFANLAKFTRAERGNLLYIVHRSLKDPRCFFVYESYRDKEAFGAHYASMPFRQYGIQGLHKICESRDAEEYESLQFHQ